MKTSFFIKTFGTVGTMIFLSPVSVHASTFSPVAFTQPQESLTVWILFALTVFSFSMSLIAVFFMVILAIKKFDSDKIMEFLSNLLLVLP